jgi:hypothetical protein
VGSRTAQNPSETRELSRPAGNGTQFLGRPVRSLVTVSTELARFLVDVDICFFYTSRTQVWHVACVNVLDIRRCGTPLCV